ncbi:MAG TPA: selenocysteine-specific translation elongation factor [Pyrinomonadaceae bacterium]|nr:selenocysteine-specific translation elongation factor [Pyrinomonadaceae bacterium]
MDIIVGTAGHIDHGKTALVKALTGVETDRFPEEKLRGITIDIGFAELRLGEAQIGFVDVPGHEKFVKNMLAGASGIDVVLLVVAADEGVMPQTREHFEICRLLETQTGLIVLTKKDLVDEELLELVNLELAELVENSFLQDAPVVAVSAKTGEGIEQLKQTLKNLAQQIPARKNETVARLPIDRSFTVKGFGAVVTGTLVAGEIAEAQEEMEILPIGKKVRVRGIQTHGKAVKTAHAGQRTAVNLGGIDHAEIERGMILTEKNILRPVQIFDAEIEVLKTAKKSLRSRQRVRVHIGTIEALARVQVLNEKGEIPQGEKDFAQLRLEIPTVCIPGERFILRQYSPQMTIAGGRVLDNSAVKHRRKDTENVRQYLQNLTKADKPKQIKLYLETADEHGLTFHDLQARTGWRGEILKKAIAENLEKKAVIEAESFFVARSAFENLKEKTLSVIETFHAKEPLSRGILRETLREKIFSRLPSEIFKAVLAGLETDKKIAAEKDFVRAAAHNLELSADEKILRERLSGIYRAAKLEVPKLEDALTEASKNTKSDKNHARKIFQLLLNSGEIVKITDEFYFARTEIENLVAKLQKFAENSADKLIDMAAFKDIAGISRKYAIPLLEYFDRERVTRRAGDKRLIL